MLHDDRRTRRRDGGHRLRRNRYRPALIELEPRRLLSAYVVDDSSDLPLDPAKGPGETANGTITLRSAIQQVDIDGSGSIGFASAMTIATSGLPTITANGVTIDGGSLGSVKVEGNGDGASGLVLAGDDALITGLEIVGFGGDGIDVGATGTTIGGTAAGAGNVIFGNIGSGISLGSFGGSAMVQGNFIGTNVAGTAGLGNGGSGIYIGSAGNTIGGPSASARNVISGNAADGVDIAGAGATGNVVAGDFIGTNPAGSAALANYTGVEIEGGASDNLIGTNGDGVNDAAERDTISGNLLIGVCISGSGTDGNVVAGDFIGTDVTATMAVGNDSLQSESGGGVVVQDGASRNLIGTTGHSADDAGQRNVISGNIFNDGVAIVGAGTGDDVVAGNDIGTDVTGAIALPNGYEGVLLLDLTTTDYIGVNPLYGSPSADQQNVISGNAAGGIEINATTGSVVAGNLIGTNAAGTAAIPNVEYDGVFIEKGSTNNLIGTSGQDGAAGDALERNVISGNDGYGVSVTGAATAGNVIAGNYIGTDAAGTAALGNGQAGVWLSGGTTDNTIGGTITADRNVISGNGNRGVYISTPAGSTSPTTGNVVEGNYIGTDASGLVPMGNHLNDAVSIDLSPGNTIGGTVAGAGNVLDAGDDTGVFIYGDDQLGPYASAADNLIAGNIIGLAADGETAAGFGNQYDGIAIDSAPATTIGGTVAAARNIISNNTNNQGAGILITNFEEPDGSYGTVVQGNYIGTDITGTKAVGNDIGVDIEGASSALIGIAGEEGTAGIPGGNLISGNLTAGIIINAAPADVGGSTSLPGAADNIVVGNWIGTTAGGTQGLGNGGDGVLIEGGATGNTIGGTSAGAANLIAFNGGDGVGVGLGASDASLDNPILEDSIFSNAGLGIDVNDSAPQAAPTLGLAMTSGSQTTVTGTVTGAKNATFLVEFFSNPAGTGQGETYLGSVEVATGKSGVAPFTFSPASIVAAGRNITATATDPNGNTSEFSAPATVQPAPVDVTSDLSVKPLPIVYNRRTGLATQKLIITNKSHAPIAGPIELVLLDLEGATLVNQTGTTQGNPYITILSSGSLGVGQSLTVTLTFADPTGVPITYVPEFLAGPIPPPDDAD